MSGRLWLDLGEDYGFFPRLAKAAAEAGSFPPKSGGGGGVVTPPQLPLAGSFTGGGTTGIALNITGDVMAADGAVTITGLSVDGLTFDPVSVDLAAGDAPQDAAAKIAAALENLADTTAAETLHAGVSGSTVNVSGTGGSPNVFDADPVVTWP